MKTLSIRTYKRSIALIALAVLTLQAVVLTAGTYGTNLKNFDDTPVPVAVLLALFATAVGYASFVWLGWGFFRAFGSESERVISVVGMIVLIGMFGANILTWVMDNLHYKLWDWQTQWQSWSSVVTFVFILIVVLLITISEPIAQDVGSTYRRASTAVGKWRKH